VARRTGRATAGGGKSRAEVLATSAERRKPNSKLIPASALSANDFSANHFSSSHYSSNPWIPVFCVLLAMATIALYLPVTGHAFLTFDDHDYVTANSHVRAGLGWSTVKWALTATTAANWHPLTWLSHALDYQLFALNPAGHHLDSVLLHALNTMLLFLLLRWATKRVGPSLLVAALFALHPINVESVAWVAERKNVLSTLFFLLAIGAYGWYAQKPAGRRYLLVVALFAAGLMAKPMVITLPFVLLLLDYWPLQRTAGSTLSAFHSSQATVSKLLLEKIPLLFLSAASALITVKAQRSGMAVRSLHQFSLAVRVDNALVAYVSYLGKMFWPAGLAPLYPHPGDTLPTWQIAFSALILAGVTLFVLAFRRRRYLPVGWFWFLGTLIPVIGLVQVGDAAMADRYAYVPLIGIFVMIVWSLHDWADAKNVRLVWRIIPALCACAALSLGTVRQLSYWENEYTLWTHTLAVTDGNPFAHDALGSALLEPDLVATLNREANLDTDQKRMDGAHEQYEEALKIRRQLAQKNPAAYLPDMATTLNSLGNVNRLRNHMEEARQNYEEALTIHHQLAQQNIEPYPPDLAMTLNNLGFLERVEKQPDAAYPHFEEALKIYRRLVRESPDTYLPDMAMTLNNLAISEKDQHDGVHAREHYEETLGIRRQLAEQNPDAVSDVAMTLNDLGNLDGVENKVQEARGHYEESSRLYRQLAQTEPDKYLPYVAGTLNNLGFLDKNQNRIEESRAHYTEAMAIYRQLAQGDSARYEGDVARVDASLKELEKMTAKQR
jgi:tetratricopeptide (TPR) repeat protein